MDWSAGLEESVLNDPSTWAGLDSALWIMIGWGVGASCLLIVMTLIVTRTRRLRFWCVEAQRNVEVELEECGLVGVRPRRNVKSCSAFDPPTAVMCDRTCLVRDVARATPVARHAA